MAAQTVYPRARHFREKFLLCASVCPLPYSSVGARSFGETLAATLRTRRAALDMCTCICTCNRIHNIYDGTTVGQLQQRPGRVTH